jgi:Tfp pilus assembly major pilin PilA
MNVEKTKVMRISMQPSPIKIMIAQKQLENVEYFNYLDSMITNYARCAREIKWLKQHSTRRRIFSPAKWT